jgi:hypothetical protein
MRKFVTFRRTSGGAGRRSAQPLDCKNFMRQAASIAIFIGVSFIGVSRHP